MSRTGLAIGFSALLASSIALNSHADIDPSDRMRAAAAADELQYEARRSVDRGVALKAERKHPEELRPGASAALRSEVRAFATAAADLTEKFENGASDKEIRAALSNLQERKNRITELAEYLPLQSLPMDAFARADALLSEVEGLLRFR